MTSTYIVKLGLRSRPTNVNTEKIDGLVLKTHGIISARILLQNSQRKIRFFKETFLLDDINIEVVLGICFLVICNVDVEFIK